MSALKQKMYPVNFKINTVLSYLEESLVDTEHFFNLLLLKSLQPYAFLILSEVL